MDAATSELERRITASITARTFGPTEFALAAEPAAGYRVDDRRVTVTANGSTLAPRTILDDASACVRVFIVGEGVVEIAVNARVLGRADPLGASPIDLIRAQRPSRYVPSDTLTPLARHEFAGLHGVALVRAVDDWVHERLEYRPEATAPTSGALETLNARAGVCRDFAHVAASMLRALDVPTRFVSVFAPGLEPRDFHAVVEAYVDGRWLVIDPTRLAPRSTMVRIATGRDAADTAWLTTTLTDIELLSVDVTAHSSAVGSEHPHDLVELS